VNSKVATIPKLEVEDKVNSRRIKIVKLNIIKCNNPMIGSYNHYHLSPNGIPRGNQRWYGLVYLIHIAGKPRIRPRE